VMMTMMMMFFCLFFFCFFPQEAGHTVFDHQKFAPSQGARHRLTEKSSWQAFNEAEGGFETW